MTATLDMDTSQFAASIEAELANVKVPCQAAMAGVFADAAYNSFGEGGGGRMSEWKDLSTKYAKKYHGGNRTPTLVLSGALRESIRDGIDTTNPDFASVSTDVPYATIHQFGLESEEGFPIPARPFFPIVSNDVYEPVAVECIEACENKLKELLQ